MRATQREEERDPPKDAADGGEKEQKSDLSFQETRKPLQLSKAVTHGFPVSVISPAVLQK